MDTLNKFGVASQNGEVVILMPPRKPMTEDEAMMFAAWIVTLADKSDGLYVGAPDKFERALAAIQSK